MWGGTPGAAPACGPLGRGRVREGALRTVPWWRSVSPPARSQRESRGGRGGCWALGINGSAVAVEFYVSNVLSFKLRFPNVLMRSLSVTQAQKRSSEKPRP